MSNNPFPPRRNSSYPVSDLPRYHQARCIDVGVSRRKLSRQDKRRGEIRKNVESCVTGFASARGPQKKKRRKKERKKERKDDWNRSVGGWLLGTKVNTKLNRMDAHTCGAGAHHGYRKGMRLTTRPLTCATSSAIWSLACSRLII